MTMTTVQIKLEDVTLEAKYSPPSHPTHEENRLAVLLHPWSWLGGQMNDPVLISLIAPLNHKGYHVLRYNSRGVGRSTGWPSFSGLNEAKDLEQVIAWVAAENLGVSNVTSVVVIGYSHGSLIASLCPVEVASLKTSHILISYPLGPRRWLTMFHSATYASHLKALTDHPESNVLIVHGDHDEFTSRTAYESWHTEVASPRTRVLQIEGGSHFWRGEDGDRLVLEIEQWLL